MATIEYDQLATDYSRHRDAHAGVLNDLLQAVVACGARRVLEVGCGTGNYIGAIGRETRAECWGVDPSAEMLERARAGAAGCQFILGTAEALPVAGPFDLLFSVDVIHHVADRPAYWRRAGDLLAPGGLVCTATDSAEIIRRRVPLTSYFPESAEADLARYPAVETLREEMAAAGFGRLYERTVERAYKLRDAGAYRARAFSSLHLISEEAWQRGLARLEADLRRGPVRCVSRYVLLWGEGKHGRAG